MGATGNNGARRIWVVRSHCYEFVTFWTETYVDGAEDVANVANVGKKLWDFKDSSFTSS